MDRGRQRPWVPSPVRPLPRSRNVRPRRIGKPPWPEPMVRRRGARRVRVRGQLLGQLALLARLFALEGQVVGVEGTIDGVDGYRRGPRVRRRAVQLRQGVLTAFVVHSASSVVIRSSDLTHDSRRAARLAQHH